MVVPAAPFESAAGIVAANQGTVTSTHSGNIVTVSVPDANPGDTLFIYAYSAPQFLGSYTLSAARELSVDDSALPTGKHHLTVLTSSGTLIGWTAITVGATTAVTTDVKKPADTGFNAAPYVLSASALLALGIAVAGVVTYRRRIRIKAQSM